MIEHNAVLIVAFKRIEHILRFLPALIESKTTDIYLAVDAARIPESDQMQDSMILEFTKAVQHSNINLWIWKRSENLGAAVSIFTAIDWFFQFEEEGLILEDDLAFQSDFPNFARKCLSDFKNAKNVWMVSGNQFFEKELDTDVPILSHYPMIWGWATWRDRWQEIRESIVKGDFHTSSFPFRPKQSFWRIGRLRALSGKVDAWDTPLVSPMWEKNKFCVQPPKNLVSNMGADEYSSHTTVATWPLLLEVKPLRVQSSAYEFSPDWEIKKLDDLLTKKFYKIRFYHGFLPVYAPIKDLISSSKYKKTLQERILEVAIPETRNNIDES